MAAAAARCERTRASKHHASEAFLHVITHAGELFEMGAEPHSDHAAGRKIETKGLSPKHSGLPPILPNSITTPLLTALRQQLNLCSTTMRTPHLSEVSEC